MTETVELREAEPGDYPAIIALTNRAFREPAGQAAWKVDAVKGDGGQKSPDQAHHRAHCRLQCEELGYCPSVAATRRCDELHHHHGKHHRYRVVGGRFHLKRRADSPFELQAVGVHQKEHCRRVGGRDHRAHQQPFERGKVENQARNRTGQRRRQEYAHRRENDRWRRSAAQDRKLGSQAAVEKDDGECKRADEVGGAVIVERDVARAVLARQHSDHQEDQKQRSAEACRDQARQDA